MRRSSLSAWTQTPCAATEWEPVTIAAVEAIIVESPIHDPATERRRSCSGRPVGVTDRGAAAGGRSAPPWTASVAVCLASVFGNVPWVLGVLGVAVRTIRSDTASPVRRLAVVRNISPMPVGAGQSRARSARSEEVARMGRSILVIVGVVIALIGLLFTLQGVGIVKGSAMTGTTLWTVVGPVIIVAGLVVAATGVWRRTR